MIVEILEEIHRTRVAVVPVVVVVVTLRAAARTGPVNAPVKSSAFGEPRRASVTTFLVAAVTRASRTWAGVASGRRAR
jgi:hypothetical protein